MGVHFLPQYMSPQLAVSGVGFGAEVRCARKAAALARAAFGPAAIPSLEQADLWIPGGSGHFCARSQ